MAVHVNVFDRYRAGASAVHQLDPRVKVVATVAFIVSNVLLPDGAWFAFGLAWALVIVTSALADLGFAYTVKRSFVALPFALAAVTAIFAIPGDAVASFRLGPWDLVATDAGVIRFISIVIRSWLSVQVAIVLTATTTFPDLMHALRHLRVPAILVGVISFMYRYLFVLSDEALRLLRARESRSARHPDSAGARRTPSLVWRARVAGNMAGQLFLRSYERSDRVYNAMLARGYRGQLLTMNPHRMDSADWIAAGVTVVGVVLLQLVARLGFPG